MKKVVVVAPTLNEADNIENFLFSVLAQKPRLTGFDLEIVVADSHSADKTAEITRKIARTEPSVHYLDIKKKGLGLGLSKGLDYAVNRLKADILVTMEADLSADPSELKAFLDKLENCDFVVGSRYVSGGKIINWSWWRRLLSRLANMLLSFFAWTNKIHEFTNLYRAFKSSVWQKIRPQLVMHEGWLFVPAFTFEALAARVKTREQPIIFYDRFGGRSKMNTVSYTKNLLHYALRYSLRRYVRH